MISGVLKELLDALDDQAPSPPWPISAGDRHQADRRDDRDAHAGDDHRQGQRQLDRATAAASCE